MEGRPAFVEDDNYNVVAKMPLALKLLAVRGVIRQVGRYMEHHLEVLPRSVHTIFAG